MGLMQEFQKADISVNRLGDLMDAHRRSVCANH